MDDTIFFELLTLPRGQGQDNELHVETTKDIRI